ncbi:enoyl-CoA hydratase [Pandoraea capi]|uniref:Enoyl-CoA hydratase n=1 Tax=Pandoraea capi TaxID=2508286 RepID=A0ABY6WCU4_9BURK|nr:enoyl-CoA hydratase-related protein [Pandoraea capi]VVE48602.1 enoyl-CoA hydratase [Pandoraea capi]
MEKTPDLTRRTLMKATATIAGIVPVMTAATTALGAEQTPPAAQAAPLSGGPAPQPTTLAEVPLSADVTLTVERRGQIALLGLNRPALQNRIDPDTFRALARALYDFDHDPSLRAVVLYGHGEHFSHGIDVDAFRKASAAGSPLVGVPRIVNPLNYGPGHRTKPLIVAVHGDTWNMAHELFLSADIRIAAANTQFGQDENTHGRFPGGGSTVRFVQEAGWGNAMRYMLTGDHWTADDAYRMGTLQEIAETPQAALERAIAIANKVAACGPLGVQTTLASAHLAIDASQGPAFAALGAQYGAVYRTNDFIEGVTAEAQGRAPVFHGN